MSSIADTTAIPARRLLINTLLLRPDMPRTFTPSGP